LDEQDVNFCLKCGARLRQSVRFNRLRPVCPECGWIYFPDPKVAVAVIVARGRQVLLVSRLNEPYQGRWSLPAGFMDAGEDPIAAAKRECREETGLTIQVQDLFEVCTGRSHPHGADILLVYRAKMESGDLRAGDDAGQAAFFALDDLPVLAFDSTAQVLERFRSGPPRA
jgi:ADP-ribose pyrophosphatase YjhB (NUDIX family)